MSTAPEGGLYSLCVYVPDTHLEAVKQALFDAGAGAWGDYDQCCWQVQGMGQFRPLNGSTPALGAVGQLHCESEWRVELICAKSCLRAAIAALKIAHPYETPAFSVVENFAFREG